MTTTKDSNAVLLPEEDYSGIVETLYLVSVPGMREKLMAAKAEPLEDCVDESAVERQTKRIKAKEHKTKENPKTDCFEVRFFFLKKKKKRVKGFRAACI